MLAILLCNVLNALVIIRAVLSLLRKNDPRYRHLFGRFEREKFPIVPLSSTKLFS